MSKSKRFTQGELVEIKRDTSFTCMWEHATYLEHKTSPGSRSSWHCVLIMDTAEPIPIDIDGYHAPNSRRAHVPARRIRIARSEP
jgi:hypothetical protein